ncbi:MAG: hypothetical protein WEE66_05590 [Actinomycetota bacterium]
MRIRVLIATFATLAGLMIVPSGASARGSFDHLNPGGVTPLREQVPVNFVFVGYEPDQVGQAKFLSGLPQRYRPQVRSKMFYGLPSDLGIGYTYDFEVTYTDAAFEDRFFGALSGLADTAPLTLYQQQYNDQKTNVLDVTENHFIDAPSVERWLIDHAPNGVDTTQDTLFFINWWGRSDFKFHVYTKTGEPDPDTGLDFGVDRESRKMIAWGGTTADDEETGLGSRGTHRVWFYDLSAGPESWTDNWNVDDADLDGNGVRDYRMPAVWEYLEPGGNRPSRKLTGDLARIARYVGIDLLFTTSPLYPPALTPPRMPNSMDLDLNTYEGWPGVDASKEFIDPGLVRGEEAELLRIPTTLDRQDVALRGKAKYCFIRWTKAKICYPNRPQYPDAFANLFLYGALNRGRFTDGGGQYEATVFNYATDFDTGGGLLGYADDNWLDGTQSAIFAFVDPTIVEFGYGLSTTTIHEVGHHVGMSHPHDGFDYERGLDFGPADRFYYAWSGDESNSIMSYIDVNWDFGQFDLDNHWRTTAAEYLINANAIAADVLASDDAAAGMAALGRADAEAGLTQTAFEGHDYAGAFDHARAAFVFAKRAAHDAGVQVPVGRLGWYVLPPVKPTTNADETPTYAHVDKLGGRSHRVRP